MELSKSITDRKNSTSFLSKNGKKLLKSLEKVNKCKSNTKAGKALEKATGVDVFSDFSEIIETFVKKNPENILSIRTGGTELAVSVGIMIK